MNPKSSVQKLYFKHAAKLTNKSDSVSIKLLKATFSIPSLNKCLEAKFSMLWGSSFNLVKIFDKDIVKLSALARIKKFRIKMKSFHIKKFIDGAPGAKLI